MGKMQTLFRRIKFTFKRIHRLFNVKNASHYVWIELFEFHKKSGWTFGYFNEEKYIECVGKVDDTNFFDFTHSICSSKLIFRATILQNFDQEFTNDILVLASHFNEILRFGVVKVSVNNNFVEFYYSGDLLNYSLFPELIAFDGYTHYKLAKECFWPFKNMIETGDNPVFVFSEFLRRKEEEMNTKEII